MNEYNFKKTGEGLVFELEKEIYSKEMIDCALECFDMPFFLGEAEDLFLLTLKPKTGLDPTSLGLEFNDCLISQVRLRL